MEQTRRVNRGLRYLCLDQYKDSAPELVTANITKLDLLQSFDLDIVHLPVQSGFPHDGASVYRRIYHSLSAASGLTFWSFLKINLEMLRAMEPPPWLKLATCHRQLLTS